VTIQATHDVTMSPNDKFSAIGDVQITAGHTAVVSDIYANGSLTVSAPSIEIQTRNPAPVATASGGFSLDTGVQFVADSIAFSTTPTVVGGGASPVYATSSGTVTNAGPGTVVQFTPTASDFKPTSGGGGGPLLTPAVMTLPSNPSATLASTVATAEGTTEQRSDTGVTLSQMNEVLSQGTFARASNFEEMMLAYESRRSRDQTRRLAAADKTRSATAGDSEVTAILKAYHALYWKNVVNKDTQKTESVYRAPEIKQMFTEALDAYRAKNLRPDVNGYRSFIFNTYERSSELRDVVSGLAALIEQVERLGLTPAELAVAKVLLLRDVRPAGVGQKDFETLLRGRPSPGGGTAFLYPGDKAVESFLYRR
jgi:hypothetical protein